MIQRGKPDASVFTVCSESLQGARARAPTGIRKFLARNVKACEPLVEILNLPEKIVGR